MSIGLAILGLVGLLGVFLFLRIRRRYNSAMNILMARYTFDRLSRPEQNQVKDEAKKLVKKTGLKIQGYENNVERFGWYAQAMRVLQIPSKLPENPSWFKIGNPSKAIKQGDVFLNTVAGLIKQNYSIDITI